MKVIFERRWKIQSHEDELMPEHAVRGTDHPLTRSRPSARVPQAPVPAVDGLRNSRFCCVRLFTFLGETMTNFGDTGCRCQAIGLRPLPTARITRLTAPGAQRMLSNVECMPSTMHVICYWKSQRHFAIVLSVRLFYNQQIKISRSKEHRQHRREKWAVPRARTPLTGVSFVGCLVALLWLALGRGRYRRLNRLGGKETWRLCSEREML
jgi:hypothetical protein